MLIGTASWTDPTLVKEGNFYPPDAKTSEARLRQLTRLQVLRERLRDPFDGQIR